MKVIGIEKIEYTSKKTNLLVRGVKFHLISEEVSNNPKFSGHYTDVIYIPESRLDSNRPVRVGDHVKIYYNKFGSVEGYDVS